MGKAKLKAGNGSLIIEQEGTIKKFVKDVEQITFSGKYAKPWQEILFITERCVFRLLGGRMTVTEIAPGIDLETDILAQMDFIPDIADELKLMNPGIFRETWGGLGEYLGGGLI
jgi:propionate CoA-transferase